MTISTRSEQASTESSIFWNAAQCQL